MWEIIGKTYTFQHHQDCCESVGISDINGDLQDLVGSPIITAESNMNTDPNYIEWTFYHFATIKGSVAICWRGDGNSYYSIEVSYEVK